VCSHAVVNGAESLNAVCSLQIITLFCYVTSDGLNRTEMNVSIQLDFAMAKFDFFLEKRYYSALTESQNKGRGTSFQPAYKKTPKLQGNLNLFGIHSSKGQQPKQGIGSIRKYS
jgi:hypothetical protein